ARRGRHGDLCRERRRGGGVRCGGVDRMTKDSMTRDQFIHDYLRNSGLPFRCKTVTGLRIGKRSRVALPCACGEESCRGWAMINDDPADIADHNRFYGRQMEPSPAGKP